MGYPIVLVKAGKMGCGLQEVFNCTYSNGREHLRSEEGSKMAVFVVPCSNLVLVFWELHFSRRQSHNVLLCTVTSRYPS